MAFTDVIKKKKKRFLKLVVRFNLKGQRGLSSVYEKSGFGVFKSNAYLKSNVNFVSYIVAALWSIVGNSGCSGGSRRTIKGRRCRANKKRNTGPYFRPYVAAEIEVVVVIGRLGRVESNEQYVRLIVFGRPSAYVSVRVRSINYRESAKPPPPPVLVRRPRTNKSRRTVEAGEGTGTARYSKAIIIQQARTRLDVPAPGLVTSPQ